MKTWNRNEWQGKRRDQVEFSEKMVFYSMLLIMLSTLVLYIAG